MYKITLRPLDSYRKGIRPVLCTCDQGSFITGFENSQNDESKGRVYREPMLLLRPSKRAQCVDPVCDGIPSSGDAVVSSRIWNLAMVAA
eukprot:scaffold99150_cov19-Cyclotella_meneghiniana.AAC.1